MTLLLSRDKTYTEIYITHAQLYMHTWIPACVCEIYTDFY